LNFKILGTGSCLPSLAITNDELSEFLDTSDEWITQRVGVRQRRYCTTERTVDLAKGAALKAFEMSCTSPQELDMIICATVSADDAAPSLACALQAELGATCPAMDVNAACSGFIYALETAAGFFARGAKKILVIGAERLTRHINWNDRSTAVIFGDGAGAAVLGAGNAYLSSKLCARGDSIILGVYGHSGSSPYSKLEPKQPYIHMNGQETFKFAVKSMCTDLTDVIAAAGLAFSDIAWFLPHQANLRIIDMASKKLGIPAERCLTNIDKVGNTSAASLPILTDELYRSGKLKEGDYIALASFGAGLTSAACVIRV